jgi:hypothetical protein
MVMSWLLRIASFPLLFELQKRRILAVFSTFGYWPLFTYGRSAIFHLGIVVALLSDRKEDRSLAIKITVAITNIEIKLPF